MKVCITGGPSGGKTTLIESIHRELAATVAVVPEAATILYRGGFPRRKGPAAQIHAQKAIYYTQFELEALSTDENRGKLIICDRGSLDGIAYWPDQAATFFTAIRSDMKRECARYDWILHLDTAQRDSYDMGNPIRIESFEEAQQLNLKVLQAWKEHSQRLIIPHYDDFLGKMSLALEVIRAIMRHEPHWKIKTMVESYRISTANH
jgi:nicotinamide riboside kinase